MRAAASRNQRQRQRHSRGRVCRTDAAARRADWSRAGRWVEAAAACGEERKNTSGFMCVICASSPSPSLPGVPSLPSVMQTVRPPSSSQAFSFHLLLSKECRDLFAELLPVLLQEKHLVSFSPSPSLPYLHLISSLLSSFSCFFSFFTPLDLSYAIISFPLPSLHLFFSQILSSYFFLLVSLPLLLLPHL